MPQTLAMFVLALRYISDVAAGPLASLVISHLRARFPPPSSAPASPLARLALFALWSPRYARISAMVLAAIISIPCALLAGFAQGEAVLPLADALLAAALSQVFHAFTDKSAEVPYAPKVHQGFNGRVLVGDRYQEVFSRDWDLEIENHSTISLDRLSDLGGKTGVQISGTCKIPPSGGEWNEDSDNDQPTPAPSKGA